MPQQVVAHFIDHSVVKGTSVDVDPAKPRCHIRTGTGTIEVDLAQLKALYFVKDLEGRPEYDEERAAKAGDSRLRGSHPVKLTFMDGELLHGLMNRFPPNRPFFFVLPIDPASNNDRILVNRQALVGVEALDITVPQPPPVTDAGGTPRPQRTGWVFDGKGIRHIDADRRK
jgi:hypothetical protein